MTTEVITILNGVMKLGNQKNDTWEDSDRVRARGMWSSFLKQNKDVDKDLLDRSDPDDWQLAYSYQLSKFFLSTLRDLLEQEKGQTIKVQSIEAEFAKQPIDRKVDLIEGATARATKELIDGTNENKTLLTMVEFAIFWFCTCIVPNSFYTKYVKRYW